MKKNLKIVLFSCLIGAVLAGVFFLNIKVQAEEKNKSIVYVLQVGVFKQEQNAINLAKNYPITKICKGKDFYRVFIGVSIKNIELIEKFYAAKEINYFKKEIELKEEIQNELLKYDELLIQANKENQETVIKKMLELLPDEL